MPLGKLGQVGKYDQSLWLCCIWKTVFLIQVFFFFKTKCGTHGKSLKHDIDFIRNYAGKSPGRFGIHGVSFLHYKHEQTVFGIKLCETNEWIWNDSHQKVTVYVLTLVGGENLLNAVTVGKSSAASHTLQALVNSCRGETLWTQRMWERL
jgi:hypothetical protein